MTGAEYKLRFDGTAATRAQLTRFETITVEQDSDRPWQARLEVSVCLDEQGSWRDDDEPFMQVGHRVRVEVRVGSGDFRPLIDGPVIGFDSERRSAPGQSFVTVLISDDSVLLNRTAAPATYPAGLKDSEIASRIFGEYSQLGRTLIDTTPDAPNPLPAEQRRRTTDIQFLRQLARRNHFVCAVLPGDSAGSSIGVFHAAPVFTDEPPPLVLLGRDRSIETFDVRLTAQDRRNVVASTLSFSDKGTVTRRSQVRGIELGGETLLRPGSGEDVDLQHRVDAEAARNDRAFEATGTLRQGCYAGVLTPQHPVKVKLGTTPTSGTYTIDKVTHRLGRSEYQQQFTLYAERLEASAAGGGLVPAGLF